MCPHFLTFADICAHLILGTYGTVRYGTCTDSRCHLRIFKIHCVTFNVTFYYVKYMWPTLSNMRWHLVHIAFPSTYCFSSRGDSNAQNWSCRGTISAPFRIVCAGIILKLLVRASGAKVRGVNWTTGSNTVPGTSEYQRRATNTLSSASLKNAIHLAKYIRSRLFPTSTAILTLSNAGLDIGVGK